MLSAQVAPLCCDLHSIPSFTACFVRLHVCAAVARPPGLPASLTPPGLRAVHPALVQSSSTVHARCSHHPACLPVRPPASYVCMCVCCRCARPPGLPACLTPPGLRAVHPALVQSSCAVHARCSPPLARLPARPPASVVCRCVLLLHARLVCLPPSPRLACVPCIQH